MAYINKINVDGVEYEVRGTAYVQSEEPADVPNGTLWYDTDEEVEQETTSLPSVSTADNGKFLRVVDGAWSAVIVNSAEGVSF